MAPSAVSKIPIIIATLGASYYLYSETVRLSTIRRRRQVAHAKRARRRASTSSTSKAGAQEDKDEEAELAADTREAELQIAREQFGSVVIGGRWANMGTRWREQGAWEWLFWKLIWSPLTGRVWWDGGLPLSESLTSLTFPACETPNFALLFGHSTPASPKHKHITRLQRTASSPVTSSDEGAASEGERELGSSWEQLSVPDTTGRQQGFGTDEPRVDPRASAADEVGEDLTFTWIGQSTCFVQLEGVGILTDPVFAERTIPSALAPPRLRPPPPPRSAFTSIDVVLVSHDHFDHIHPDDVLALGDSVQWFVPLGLAPFLQNLGVTRVTEMDWWDTKTVELEVNLRGQGKQLKKVEVACTPTQHWSARSIAANQSLWASFVVKGERQSFYHCGDTGYCPELFKAIGRVFGPITLAATPIGAYCPRWHLSNQHVDPEGACLIHQDLGARYSVGVHWGTWILSDERYDDPPKDLALACEKLGLTENEFRVVPPGRTVNFAEEEH